MGSITAANKKYDRTMPQIMIEWPICLLAVSDPESTNIEKQEMAAMKRLDLKKRLHCEQIVDGGTLFCCVD